MGHKELDMTATFTYTHHAKAMKYTLLSFSYGIFSTIDHMLGCKTSFITFKKIEITSRKLLQS